MEELIAVQPELVPGSPAAGAVSVTRIGPLTPAFPAWMCARLGVSMPETTRLQHAWKTPTEGFRRTTVAAPKPSGSPAFASSVVGLTSLKPDRIAKNGVVCDWAATDAW